MNTHTWIDINTQTQTLTWHNQNTQHSYPISTAKNGTGQLQDSQCTPLGRHIIAQKIGDGLPLGAVMVGRVFTGEICTPNLMAMHPQRDWILTRILWLEGCEDGYNRGVQADGQVCDSFARYIYIHGTPDSEGIGIANSHGCVRMRNTDLIELFDLVQVGTLVDIQ